MAEYREMPMVSSALRRTINSKSGLERGRIKKQYTLNAGHVMFFYDKGMYLYKRYMHIKEVLAKRGFNLNSERQPPNWHLFKDHGLFNDYKPDVNAKVINTQRLIERFEDKPQWYKMCGLSVTEKEYIDILHSACH